MTERTEERPLQRARAAVRRAKADTTALSLAAGPERAPAPDVRVGAPSGGL
jgi:hypothetical protein